MVTLRTQKSKLSRLYLFKLLDIHETFSSFNEDIDDDDDVSSLLDDEVHETLADYTAAYRELGATSSEAYKAAVRVLHRVGSAIEGHHA